ncbi:MAG: multicopper oxidase domain-containing protein [Crocinitomicaceae bacterium]|nr:multicopper oxidase domain-containing protein [Flavobacteriales bacterium]NQZ38404.1 multicopper oxidase domain-containing protein [Crocinitomicaceae bacterium]
MFQKNLYRFFLIAVLLQCIPLISSAQIQDELIIGRSTGTFFLDETQSIRVSGFTNRLSEQVSLPGTAMSAIVGDSVVVDFWNISQADPHDFVINGITTEKSSKWHHDTEDFSIHHMDHGFYQFVAEQPGTHVYYCPVKFPFNVQAGMFGVLIIREKKRSDVELQKERLWCGFELDTNWHTDALLDDEIYDPREKYTLNSFPTYSPQYFLINGIQEKKTSDSLAIRDVINSPITLRIVNTGLYKHEIRFPKKIEIVGLNKDLGDILSVEKDSSKITLEPLETVELILSASSEIDASITYNYLNPAKGKIEFVQIIPIILKNPSLN